MKTITVHIDSLKIGEVKSTHKDSWIQDWDLLLDESEYGAGTALLSAAQKIKNVNIPVAFPTETVYGLGADATRSDAVKSIFAVKGRPADNPLIVHFASINQITNLVSAPIPAIYHPLIKKFWPGPLTIILPLSSSTLFAPEVTAGLSTFGARIPASPIALALIKLAGVPIAAPSANTSTRPSPTTAQHVVRDLDGRIELVLDGGACAVGVESTVVDGLSLPPAILRPGGVGIEELRSCEGWENVGVAYKDSSQHVVDKFKAQEIPRAPGMKYRHYSPEANVLLYEEGSVAPSFAQVVGASKWKTVGFIRTKTWGRHKMFSDCGSEGSSALTPEPLATSQSQVDLPSSLQGFISPLYAAVKPAVLFIKQVTLQNEENNFRIPAFVIDLGSDPDDIARGIFSALRDLDAIGVDAIYVEGILEDQGNVAAAVMNRLRKASENVKHEEV